jgi:membrane fusion protein, multidrug efflux system
MAEIKNEASDNPRAESAVKKKANGKRRRWVLIIGTGLLIVALAFGIPFVLQTLSHESTDDAFIDGTIVAVRPRVSGYVAQVMAGDNQWVHAGDPLVTLESADYKAACDAARATLEAARAGAASAGAVVKTAEAEAAASGSLREQAQAQVNLSKASLAQARAALASKVAEHERDALDLKRARELAKKVVITHQALDHAVAAERISAAEVEAAERKIDTQKAMIRQAEASLGAAADNLRQAKAQVDVRRAQESQARADIDRAAAELEMAELRLSYTKIIAPTDGYVTRKNVEQGALVQADQTLMSIVRSGVWVTANFKETQLTRMRPGQPVRLTVDAFPDVSFNGRVDSIQHGTGARFSLLPAENATGNYIKVVQRVPVKIVFDQDDQLSRYPLVPGLSVVPEVDVADEGTRTASDGQASGSGAAEASNRSVKAEK